MELLFDSSGKYLRPERNDYDPSHSQKYLFQKTSGKPGLFLTGNISADSIKKLSNEINHPEFIRTKIMWLTKSKLVNRPVFKTLNKQIQQVIETILKEIKDRQEEISNQVISELRSNDPERTLLTIRING